ncbi:MAG: hypothetical protein ACXAB8_13910 [Promethearchaeota archaeon]|jgi:hypothetical protein
MGSEKSTFDKYIDTPYRYCQAAIVIILIIFGLVLLFIFSNAFERMLLVTEFIVGITILIIAIYGYKKVKKRIYQSLIATIAIISELVLLAIYIYYLFI